MAGINWNPDGLSTQQQALVQAILHGLMDSDLVANRYDRVRWDNFRDDLIRTVKAYDQWRTDIIEGLEKLVTEAQSVALPAIFIQLPKKES